MPDSDSIGHVIVAESGRGPLLPVWEAVSNGVFQWLTIVAEATPCGVGDMRSHLHECARRIVEPPIRNSFPGDEAHAVDEVIGLIVDGLVADSGNGSGADSKWRTAAEDIVGLEAMAAIALRWRRWAQRPRVARFLQGMEACEAIERALRACIDERAAGVVCVRVTAGGCAGRKCSEFATLELHVDPGSPQVWGDRKWLRRAFTSFSQSPTLRAAFGPAAGNLRIRVSLSEVESASADVAEDTTSAHSPGEPDADHPADTAPVDSWLPEKSGWHTTSQRGGDVVPRRCLRWTVRGAEPTCVHGFDGESVELAAPFFLPDLP